MTKRKCRMKTTVLTEMLASSLPGVNSRGVSTAGVAFFLLPLSANFTNKGSVLPTDKNQHMVVLLLPLAHVYHYQQCVVDFMNILQLSGYNNIVFS